MSQAAKHPLVDMVRQSPPLDLSAAIDDGWVKDKTIVITGGASGFGAGFLKRWAAAGANVVIGDINVEKGDQLVRETMKETGNTKLHFFHCNVTDWRSQVQFFKEAVKASPHGGIDTVVANAGIADTDPKFETPVDLDAADPSPPDLKVLDVNLKGVLYTAHLALFYLPRNPGSSPSSPKSDPTRSPRDRHLILMSSLAGLGPFPGQVLYGASKHAVVGLFRSLRGTSFTHGVRTNMLCPYFIDTPILNTGGRVLLAGSSMGKVEDVVEAATRYAADPCIVGRSVIVGPKTKVNLQDNGQWTMVEGENEGGIETAILEVYAHDFEDSDLFTRNFVSITNRIVEIRGWAGWLNDIVAIIRNSIKW